MSWIRSLESLWRRDDGLVAVHVVGARMDEGNVGGCENADVAHCCDLVDHASTVPFVMVGAGSTLDAANKVDLVAASDELVIQVLSVAVVVGALHAPSDRISDGKDSQVKAVGDGIATLEIVWRLAQGSAGCRWQP